MRKMSIILGVMEDVFSIPDNVDEPYVMGFKKKTTVD